ncbi:MULTISPECIES: hypothetical protein [Paracoccus]|uniref:Uncharacterized protein n=1 Tax=Paracoccus onubensis TaxID=1675788 RepID=A0A418SWN7_9RHOB|nr:hypothetical protein [Paracoccus onubensis]MDP0925896.1 hypothetical protein [Paracoccus onubensis]RJE85373.1 hypothetical protein D3P04_10175 [Paracoccus onubensis]
MPERPLFLERASFRRRRLGDAARVLPVLAAIAMLLPVWWLPKAFSFATGMLALFGFWAVLILSVRLLHRALIRADAAALAETAVLGDAPGTDDATVRNDRDAL